MPSRLAPVRPGLTRLSEGHRLAGMSNNTEREDRHATQSEELDAYEPPRIVVLGSFPELTATRGGAGALEPRGITID